MLHLCHHEISHHVHFRVGCCTHLSGSGSFHLTCCLSYCCCTDEGHDCRRDCRHDCHHDCRHDFHSFAGHCSDLSWRHCCDRHLCDPCAASCCSHTIADPESGTTTAVMKGLSCAFTTVTTGDIHPCFIENTTVVSSFLGNSFATD